MHGKPYTDIWSCLAVRSSVVSTVWYDVSRRGDGLFLKFIYSYFKERTSTNAFFCGWLQISGLCRGSAREMGWAVGINSVPHSVTIRSLEAQMDAAHSGVCHIHIYSYNRTTMLLMREAQNALYLGRPRVIHQGPRSTYNYKRNFIFDCGPGNFMQRPKSINVTQRYTSMLPFNLAAHCLVLWIMLSWRVAVYICLDI